MQESIIVLGIFLKPLLKEQQTVGRIHQSKRAILIWSYSVDDRLICWF